MKNKLMRLLLVGGSVMLLSGTLAFAVVPNEMHVKIPFKFEVEGTTLPAGEYVISNPLPASMNMVAIRSENGDHSVFVMTMPLHWSANSPKKPDLVFKKFDGTEYLAQIWAAPGSIGNQVPITHEQAMTAQVGTR
jgi:hypothetical protein